MSPLIFRKQKPTTEKPKVHHKRPAPEFTDNLAKAQVNKVAEGFENYLDLISSLYYGYLPSLTAKEKGDLILDRMLSPMRTDLVFGNFFH